MNIFSGLILHTGEYFDILVYATIMSIFIPTLQRFLQWNETRPGKVILHDPILEMFNAHDMSHLVTTCTIASHAYVIYSMLQFDSYKMRLLQIITVNIIVSTLRVIFMFVCPFQVCPDVIPLDDKVIQTIFRSHVPFNHDLMFSGHIAQQCILVLFFPSVFLYCTFALTVLGIILSKAHYCIDILVSPFVTFTVFELVTNHLLI